MAIIWLWITPLVFGLLGAMSSFLHYRKKGYLRYQCILVGLLTLVVIGPALQAAGWVVWVVWLGNR